MRPAMREAAGRTPSLPERTLKRGSGAVSAVRSQATSRLRKELWDAFLRQRDQAALRVVNQRGLHPALIYR